MKPVLYAMIGLPCSGKTTYAMALSQQTGAVRFTPDVWQLRIFGDDVSDPEHDRRHTAVEEIMREMADEFLRRGISVILDFGFWAREERDYLRSHAHSLGADFEMHYMDTPLETIYQRLERRNASGRDDVFVISRADMEGYLVNWQPPAADEENLVRVAPQ